MPTNKILVVVVACNRMTVYEITPVLRVSKLELPSIFCFRIFLENVQQEFLLYSRELFCVQFQLPPRFRSQKKYNTIEQKVD